jgi:hypothetical protein
MTTLLPLLIREPKIIDLRELVKCLYVGLVLLSPPAEINSRVEVG